MPAGWVKHFDDGTKEEGFDELVDAGKASWRKGRLAGIKSVSLTWEDKDYVAALGTGEYWQSDDLVAPFIPGKSVEGLYVTRRLQKKISLGDVGLYLSLELSDGKVDISLEKSDDPNCADRPSCLFEIRQKDVGRWLTVELCTRCGKLSITLEESKI